jgi:hypothetical protein
MGAKIESACANLGQAHCTGLEPPEDWRQAAMPARSAKIPRLSYEAVRYSP